MDLLKLVALDQEDLAVISAHLQDAIVKVGDLTYLPRERRFALVARRFPATTHASSTKGFTGHTLGAAGIVEAVISLLALENGWMPGTINSSTLDAECGPQIRLQGARGNVRYALSNSFGFGGNNCALIFGKGAAA